MGQVWPLMFIFVLFATQWQICIVQNIWPHKSVDIWDSNIVQNIWPYKSVGIWDSNPGLQFGRRSRIRWVIFYQTISYNLATAVSSLLNIEFYLFVHSLPSNGQTEDRCNWRRQVGRDGLDVDVQLASLHRLDDGDPCYAHCDLHKLTSIQWVSTFYLWPIDYLNSCSFSSRNFVDLFPTQCYLNLK